MIHKSAYLFLIGLLSIIASAAGADFIQTNALTLAAGQAFTNEVWLLANRITLQGQAQDDVFLCAATEGWPGAENSSGSIRIGGHCDNDVWALGNIIQMDGVVHDHARLLARTVSVTGVISNSALLGGTTVQLSKSSVSHADVLMFGENLIVEGRIHGNVTMLGTHVTLAGKVDKNARIIAQDIVVLPGAEIGGNLVYRAPRDLVLDNKVSLGGQLIRDSLPQPAPARARFSFWDFLVQAWLLAGALLVGAVLIILRPELINSAVGQIRQSLFKCLLTGFVAAGLAPLFSIAALLSIIGIPLGLLGLTVWLVLLYGSKIIVALALGAWILRRTASPAASNWFLPLCLGLIVLYAMVSSGLLGLALWFLMVFTGTGGFLQALFRRPEKS